MSLELTDQRVVVQVPNRDVTIGAAAETEFGVGTDGQGIAGRRVRAQLGFDARRRSGQVPDAEVARLPPDDEGARVRK